MQLTRREALSLFGSITAGGTMGTHAFLGPGANPPETRGHRGVRKRRELLYSLLGDLPDRRRPIGARTISEETRDGYVVEKLLLDLNGFEPVPAFLVRPKRLSGPVPAVLYNHSHGGAYDIGKNELLEGRGYLQQPPYANVITEQGWVGLCIDTWVFGERAHTTELDMFKAMLWQGHVLWGMMVYDSIRALDYLLTRPEVAPTRVATLGISMGSTMAWWLAALDERLKVTVDICCLTDFTALLRQNALGRHGVYYYVPSLLNHFTTAEINALIAPRPHLALAGLQDGLTPVEGLNTIDRELSKVYARHRAPQNWRLLRYDAGHQETPEGRKEIIRFLQQNL